MRYRATPALPPCFATGCACPVAAERPEVGPGGRVVKLDAHGNEHNPHGPSSEDGLGARYWHLHGRPHRTDGPTADYPPNHPYRGNIAHCWRLDGEWAESYEVIDQWLERHHPDTDDTARHLLVELAEEWPYGADLATLYTAVTVATEAA